MSVLKKKILLTGDFKKNFYHRGRDNTDKYWFLLRIALEKKGYSFHTKVEEDFSQYTYIFFNNLHDNSLIGKITRLIRKNNSYNIFKEILSRNIHNRIVLFLTEPDIVMPWNYKKDNHKNLSKIFTWKKDLVDNKKYFYYLIPFGGRKNLSKKIHFHEKKLIMNISSNKFSKIEGEHYSTRRKIIKYLDQNHCENFDLYGSDWGRNGFFENLKRFIKYSQFDFTKYKTYRGKVKNKTQIISKYKFIICYENIRYDNFITEKIFDVFVNNSVPIYLGAYNIQKYIPENTYIDRRKFDSDSELIRYISDIDEVSYNIYIKNIEDFLSSNAYVKFKNKSFVETILANL